MDGWMGGWVGGRMGKWEWERADGWVRWVVCLLILMDQLTIWPLFSTAQSMRRLYRPSDCGIPDNLVNIISIMFEHLQPLTKYFLLNFRLIFLLLFCQFVHSQCTEQCQAASVSWCIPRKFWELKLRITLTGQLWLDCSPRHKTCDS